MENQGIIITTTNKLLSEINYILYDCGFDNAIINYKKNYKIINNLNSYMLIYNLLYNNYFEIIDLKMQLTLFC